MYTLRKISENSLEFNKCLGKEYSLILFEKSPDQFWTTYDHLFIKSEMDQRPLLKEGQTPECYGFIISEHGQEILPLFKSEKNYIVTNNGCTFSNISLQ